jgi:4-hydroxybenzoate polyprenyltransferase
MITPRKLLTISRPRFWIYFAGPALVAMSINFGQDLSAWTQIWPWIFVVYFTYPANLLVYGVNDIFDYETDLKNSKKGLYEALVTPDEHLYLWMWIILLNLPFVFVLLVFSPIASKISLLLFLFLTIFYSAPPIRAKACPFMDSAFNILYIMPGLATYYSIEERLSWALVVAGALWSMAMHSYSAIPDIEADSQSKTPTIATFLGFKKTIIYCLTLYTIAAVLLATQILWLGFFIGNVYGGLMIITWIRGEKNSFAMYRLFPAINTSTGALLFWVGVLL